MDLGRGGLASRSLALSALSAVIFDTDSRDHWERFYGLLQSTGRNTVSLMLQLLMQALVSRLCVRKVDIDKLNQREATRP